MLRAAQGLTWSATRGRSTGSRTAAGGSSLALPASRKGQTCCIKAWWMRASCTGASTRAHSTRRRRRTMRRIFRRRQPSRQRLNLNRLTGLGMTLCDCSRKRRASATSSPRPACLRPRETFDTSSRTLPDRQREGRPLQSRCHVAIASYLRRYTQRPQVPSARSAVPPCGREGSPGFR